MFKKVFYISFIFFCRLSFGQFNDSLALTCYNQEIYDFTFFKKNDIKQVNHYVTVFKDNKSQRTFLDYSLVYNKENNVIIKQTNIESQEIYKEGVFGHPVICLSLSNDSDCVDWQKYDQKGRIIKDRNNKIEYDSLNHMIHIIDTTQDISRYHRETVFKYNANRIATRADLIYSRTVLTEKITYEYFYKSPTKFGYYITYPDHWVKPVTKRIYKIRNNYKELETTDYCKGIIVSRQNDVIVR
jgi:hypothetical protein